jgi:hypothetical protein
VGGEETRPEDEEPGSDETLSQAFSSFWRETKNAVKQAVNDAAEEVRREREGKMANSTEDVDLPEFLKDVPKDLRVQKEQLFDLIRVWQPNADVEDLIVLVNALWAYYGHWVTHGSGSVLATGNPDDEPVKYANEIADIIIARARRSGVEFNEIGNILLNASSMAGSAFSYLDELYREDTERNPDDRRFKGRVESRKLKTTIRYVATLRDSLEQAATLIEGGTLDAPEERVFHHTVKTRSGSVTQDEVPASELPEDEGSDAEITAVYNGDEVALRMAYAYGAMKDVRARIETLKRAGYKATEADTQTWDSKLEQAMGVIKGDISVPDNGGSNG